jgi:hypothetical protein
MRFDPADGVGRLFEELPVRPDALVIGEQFEDHLDTVDHDQAPFANRSHCRAAVIV